MSPAPFVPLDLERTDFANDRRVLRTSPPVLAFLELDLLGKNHLYVLPRRPPFFFVASLFLPWFARRYKIFDFSFLPRLAFC